LRDSPSPWTFAIRRTPFFASESGKNNMGRVAGGRVVLIFPSFFGPFFA